MYISKVAVLIIDVFLVTMSNRMCHCVPWRELLYIIVKERSVFCCFIVIMYERSNLHDTVNVMTSLHRVEEYESLLPLHLYSPLSASVALIILCLCVGGVFKLSLVHSYIHWLTPPPWMSHLRVIVSPLNIWGQLGWRVKVALLETVDIKIHSWDSNRIKHWTDKMHHLLL